MELVYLTVALQVLFASVHLIRADNLIVNTENGKVAGEKRTNNQDKSEYYAFHAIPYADPPVGDLRFKPPTAITVNWTDTYNASDAKVGNKKKCAQKALVEGSDCNSKSY